MKTKSKMIIISTLLLTTIFFSGCIDPPEKVDGLEEIEISPEDLSYFLGFNETVIDEKIDEFDVMFYGGNYKTIYDPYYDYTWVYRDWKNEYDEVFFDDSLMTIHGLVYRRFMTIHTIILINGSLVEA